MASPLSLGPRQTLPGLKAARGLLAANKVISSTGSRNDTAWDTEMCVCVCVCVRENKHVLHMYLSSVKYFNIALSTQKKGLSVCVSAVCSHE